jgi:hypothetical protein
VGLCALDFDQGFVRAELKQNRAQTVEISMVVPWSRAFCLLCATHKKLFYDIYYYSVFSTLLENCTNLYVRTVWDETSHTGTKKISHACKLSAMGQ